MTCTPFRKAVFGLAAVLLLTQAPPAPARQQPADLAAKVKQLEAQVQKLTELAGQTEAARKAEHDAALKYHKMLADTFLEACIAQDVTAIRLVMAEELLNEIRKPGVPTAECLEKWLGLVNGGKRFNFTSFRFDESEVATGLEEGLFKGVLITKDNKSANFTVQTVKEKPNGKCRVRLIIVKPNE
jgi:hypothetical protein